MLFEPFVDRRSVDIVGAADIQVSNRFPVTRYYGSKRRLIGWMEGIFADINFDTVVDVFGGTGTVSLLFKSLGKNVYYNDILESSRLQATALLSNESVEDLYATVFEFCKAVVPERSFITENFQGIYYKDFENMWLDGALALLQRVKERQRYVDIFYCLQQACIQKRPFNLFHRRNLNLRENNKQDTKFGNWRTWERSFEELMLRAAIDLRRSRWCSRVSPIILPRQDALSLSAGYDLVYLDPPYIPKVRRDISYLERYHFLEGLAMPQNWSASIDWSRASRGFVATEDVQRWNTKSTFKDNLYSLIYKHRSSVVVLSYVESAYPSREELVGYFEELFSSVEVHEKALSHALSKNQKVELLIVGVP